MKKKLINTAVMKRVAAACMAGVVLSGTFCSPAKAGAPTVKVDETVYVNMDYYGAINDISVVKGCLLNGNTTIEDYGNYDEIINMTNRVEPTSDNGKVTWNLSGENNNKFYYECKSESLKDNLPWNFDVTYKLNGVETAGENLAGASGMVTIDIKAIPNKAADEYYKNNMILMCGTGVDMDKALSIEAEGAQVQSFGTMKGVIFMALPGEEGNFRIDIGSDDFESYGVFFMMVPATLSSLEMVNDIRDVRDTAEDSFDAINDATDVLLDNVIALRKDMQTTKNGLNAAKEAKATYDVNRDSLKADADAAIDSIDAISAYLEVINNEMEVGEDNYTEVNQRLAAINATINGMREYYDDLDDRMEGIEDGIHGVKKIVDGTVTEQGLKDLVYLMEGPTVSVALKDGEAAGASKEAKQMDQLAKASDAYGAASPLGVGYTDQRSISDVGLAQLLKQFQVNLEKVGKDTVLDGLVDAEGLIDRIQDILDTMDCVLAQTDTLSHFMTEDAKRDTDKLCQQLEELVDATNVSLVTIQSAMKTMRYTLDAVEPSLDTAVDSTLNGMIGILSTGMNMTDDMETIRDAKNTVKNAIDDELDKIEEDSNILNLDVTQDFPSFTSDKNPSPQSIQIILRTEEIKKDDDKTIIDIETEPVDLGVWGRLKAIFVQIWQAITGIFK